MKKSEFLILVQEELDTIKTKATQEEIGELNLKEFVHTQPDLCIYGQMTGYCASDRAKELYPKRYFYVTQDSIDDDYTPHYKHSFKKGKDFSPLEKYLYMVHESKHIEIIQYLKNEINTIKL